MPKPEYEAIDVFTKFATNLVDKYPEQLHGIDPKMVRCVGITNKEVDEKKRWELQPVKYPMRLDLNYDFYVVVNMQLWDILDESHQAALVFDVLCSISRDGDGKIIPFDLKDHSVVVRTLGVDYMDKPDIPNILKDNVNWLVSETKEQNEDEN